MGESATIGESAPAKGAAGSGGAVEVMPVK